MKRLLRTALLTAAALSFCFSAPLTASAGSTTHGTKMKHSCPAGQHWVHGYKRNGKYVHGYCRS